MRSGLEWLWILQGVAEAASLGHRRKKKKKQNDRGGGPGVVLGSSHWEAPQGRAQPEWVGGSWAPLTGKGVVLAQKCPETPD